MPESPQRHARFADCLELLKAFNQGAARAVVVGGQAVNFWAEMFADQEPELAQYRPFTSADLDLHLPDASAQRVLRAQATSVEAERDPFGKAFTIVSHTFLIQRKGGNVLRCECSSLAGAGEDVRRTGEGRRGKANPCGEGQDEVSN